MNRRDSQSFNPITVLLVVFVGVLLLLGGYVIAQTTPNLLPPQASAQAQPVDELFKLMLGISGTIFLLVQGALLWSVIRYRARPDDLTDGPPIHGHTLLEVTWIAIPTVIVFAIAVLAYQVWTLQRMEVSNEQVIEVTGARFSWAFRYPEERLETGFLRAADLHTYVGRPVKLQMNSIDVIHSFWVPAMRVKQDVMPGRVTDIRFTPIEAGTFPVRCAELCGARHGEMVVNVIVHPDEADFNKWYEPEVEERIRIQNLDPVEQGREILADPSLPCSDCHTLDDLGWTETTGPNLNEVGDRAVGVRSDATGLSPWDYLHQSLRDPNAYISPGFTPQMPNITEDMISDEQLDAVAAYLCTRTESGEPACVPPTE